MRRWRLEEIEQCLRFLRPLAIAHRGRVGQAGFGRINCKQDPAICTRFTASWGEGTAGAGQLITTDGMGYVANDGDATWTNRLYSATTPTNWTTAGGDYSLTVSASQTINNPHNNSAPFTWTGAQMAADVQSWLDNRDANNFGWEFINTNETDLKDFRAFWTREAASTPATAAFVPTLSVTFVPELATRVMALLGSMGLIAVACGRRARRKGPLA